MTLAAIQMHGEGAIPDAAIYVHSKQGCLVLPLVHEALDCAAMAQAPAGELTGRLHGPNDLVVQGRGH